MIARGTWEAQQNRGGHLGNIWGSSKLVNPLCVFVAPNRCQKSVLDWKFGKKYIKINRILLALKMLNGGQAFTHLKAATRSGLCHVLAP